MVVAAGEAGRFVAEAPVGAIGPGRHRHARRRRSAVIASAPVALRLTAMTDARTDSEHLVTEHAMTVGRRAGRYRAVCGAPVLATSLTTPEGGRCRACTRWQAQR